MTEQARIQMAFTELAKIGPGDAVFYPGLFAGHPGEHDILPVVRFGNISRMPHEPLTIKYKIPKQSDPSKKIEVRRRVHGYLIEVRSWGGFSGSPVFLYFPIEETVGRTLSRGEVSVPDPFASDADRIKVLEYHYPRATGLRRAHLLGLVSSYYDYDLRDRGKASNTNAGLAVVIPADPIRDLIVNAEAFVKDRMEMAKRER